MSEVSDRLRQARIAAGYESATAAAQAMNVPAPTYSAHENGSRGITTNASRKYAKHFKVDPAWLLYGYEPSVPMTSDDSSAPDATLIPVYNVEASAGGGAVVSTEYQVDSLSFPEGYLRRITQSNPRDLAVISVKGDSMTPTLDDDDVVMLDVSKRDLSYDGLFVIRDNGDALLVKRIGRATRSGFVSLISDNNKHYPTVERAWDDIEVIGKVIWKGGKV